MSQRETLNDIELQARMRPLRHDARPAAYVQRPGPEHSRKLFQDVSQVDGFQLPQNLSKVPSASLKPQISAVKRTAEVSAQAEGIGMRNPQHVAHHKTEPSKVLKREAFVPPPKPIPQFVERSFAPPAKVRRTKAPRPPSRVGRVGRHMIRPVVALPVRQKVLVGMAALVLVVGSGITYAGFRSNRLGDLGAAKASIAAVVPATTTDSEEGEPSTVPITADTLRSYKVSPEAPRYIRIAKYGVIARVLQVGLTKTGALATPSNVFDSAWYKDSALPGKPGATVIDGHVSSWKTSGVFYDIKKLVAGDTIEIEKGDGTILSYSVVQVKTFPKDNVDMKSLMLPVTPGTSGLNLITCGGKYDSKTDDFSERVGVYATLN